MIANPFRLILFLLFGFFLIGCNTQPSKEPFPFDETEFDQPIRLKAMPTIHELTDSPVNSKYTTDNNQIVIRDKSITLKEPEIKKLGQPVITDNKIKKRKKNSAIEKRTAGTPKKIIAKGKTVTARGKVVMAGKPISKPFAPPATRDNDNFGIKYINQYQNLPGTVVNHILEDSKGRIWLGTSNGLVMLEGAEMKIYTTQEGLSNNNIHSLMESASGDIWIGSHSGVDVFKETLFLHFDMNEGLSFNRVTSLLETTQGAIWMGTDGGGLNILDGDSFTHFDTQNGLSSNQVSSLLESSSGAIWIGSTLGVDIYQTGTFTHYGTQEGLCNNAVWSLLESPTGAIWVGTYGGIDVLEDGIFTHIGLENGINTNRITSLKNSSTGAIYIGTYEGFYIFESGSFIHVDSEVGLSHNHVRSILESSTGTIWIGTYGEGVNLFEPGSFTHFGTNEGLSHDRIRSMMEDTNGNIWIGTDRRGLDVMESDHILHYGYLHGLNNHNILSLLESSTGEIWLGTDDGIDVLGSGSITHYGLEEGLSNHMIWSILESSTGAIWMGTSGGINVFESGSFTHYTTAEGLGSNRIYSLLESSSGAIWIGTNGGLNVYESGSFKQYNTENGLSSNRVRNLLESSTGAIWIATDEGIDIFESGIFTHYGASQGLADKSAIQLAMDSLGNIWVGTYNGLTRFIANNKGYELTSWNRTHGLKYTDFNGPSKSMFFTETNKVSKRGTLWSSIGGTVTAFEPPLADTLKPNLFITALDIMQKPMNWTRGTDIKEKVTALRNNDVDTLVFTNSDSVMLISSVGLDAISTTSDGIQWSGTDDVSPYYLPQNLQLSYDQNYLTFRFSGFKLNDQFDIVYRYMLDGMDNDWSPFTKEGKAEYRNIPPGEYTFRVRAKGRNFLWSDEKSISFTIHPPWWLTWWAYTFYMLGAVIVLVLLLKLNTNRLVQQKEQLEKTVNTRTAEVVQQKKEIELQAKTLGELNATKDKFFSIISHDLKGPINSLSSFIYIFQNHFDSLTQEEIQTLISNVDESQKNVATLLENLLSWALSQTGQIQFLPEEFDLTALLNENAEILKTQAKNKNLTLVNTQSQALLVSTHKNSIATVIRNLISNAIKFTPQHGKITYGWKKLADEIVVTIEDTGVGMEPDVAEKIFSMDTKYSNPGTNNESGSGLGLILCKEFVEKNGGKIWVKSEVNVGSKFMFSIPTVEKTIEASLT